MPLSTILYMEIWPFYSPGPQGGYLGESQPMLPCVKLCTLVTCPKTVIIPPALKRLICFHTSIDAHASYNKHIYFLSAPLIFIKNIIQSPIFSTLIIFIFYSDAFATANACVCNTTQLSPRSFIHRSRHTWFTCFT